MKGKRIASAALALCMGCSMLINVKAVNPEEKYKWLTDKGIVSGMGEKGIKDLALQNIVSREQMATLVVKAAKLTKTAEEMKNIAGKFKDVSVKRWSNGYINAASGQGYISGLGDGRFDPAANVKIQDVLVMIIRATQKADFKDVKYPEGYIKIAKEKGLLEGLNISDFTKSSDRAVAFQIIYNAINNSKVDLSKLFIPELGETVEFKDSLGRTVKIPKSISRLVPSGNNANVALYAIADKEMVSISGKYKGAAAKYISEKVKALPETGSMFASSGTLNVEEIIKINPQIMIDIGQTTKKDMAASIDKKQEQMNTPYIMIEGLLGKWGDAYRTLGKILNKSNEAAKLAQYADETENLAEKYRSEIQKRDIKIYIAKGKAGEETVPANSIHSAVLDFVGAKNIASGVSPQKGSQSAAFSPEELLKAKPDLILVDSEDMKKAVLNNPVFQSLEAVKTGKVYVVPSEPYGFLSGPPSINQIIGVKWLGNLIAPDLYKMNMVQEMQDFYKLFYHYELSASEANRILGK